MLELKRNRAFNLVEVMVVSALMTSLAGGAIVYYGDFLEDRDQLLRRRERLLFVEALESYARAEGGYPLTIDELITSGNLRFNPFKGSFRRSRARWQDRWKMLRREDGSIYDIEERNPQWRQK